jgi:uncharacterized protein (DUF3084 family)
VRRAEERIHELESEIERLESEMQRLEREIATATDVGDGRAIAELGQVHTETGDLLSVQVKAWEQLIGEIDPDLNSGPASADQHGHTGRN